MNLISKLPFSVQHQLSSKALDIIVLSNGQLVESSGNDSNVWRQSEDGWMLDVPAGQQMLHPLLFVYLDAQSSRNWKRQIRVGQGAQVTLAEVHLDSQEAHTQSESTQVELSEGARLSWLRSYQDASVTSYDSTISCRLDRDAYLDLLQVQSAGEKVNSKMSAKILGEGAEAHMRGLSFARDHQQVEHFVEVDHQAPHTVSSQLFKGISRDRARTKLNGRIHIARDAQKVVSQQMNHNLLMGPLAQAETRPELEVFADDVKANHGATVGRLDQEKMFYLISRGIPPKEAEQMLAQAFVADVVMKMSSSSLKGLAAQVVRVVTENQT